MHLSSCALDEYHTVRYLCVIIRLSDVPKPNPTRSPLDPPPSTPCPWMAAGLRCPGAPLRHAVPPARPLPADITLGRHPCWLLLHRRYEMPGPTTSLRRQLGGTPDTGGGGGPAQQQPVVDPSRHSPISILVPPLPKGGRLALDYLSLIAPKMGEM